MAYILYLDFIYRKEEEKIWQSCLNIVYKKKKSCLNIPTFHDSGSKKRSKKSYH